MWKQTRSSEEHTEWVFRDLEVFVLHSALGGWSTYLKHRDVLVAELFHRTHNHELAISNAKKFMSMIYE